MSESRKKKVGKYSPGWKGGISKVDYLIRNSKNGVDWRKSVFFRDNYTCQICGERGGKLNAHHIKPFSLNLNLRFDINNGITLCFDCHKKTDTYGNKNNFSKYRNL